MSTTEFLYFKYTDSEPSGQKNTRLLYTLTNGINSYHIYSPDKDAYDHQYANLTPGNWYVAVSNKVTQRAQGYNRWVFSIVIQCDNKQQCVELQKLMGRNPSLEVFKKSITQVLVQQRLTSALQITTLIGEL